MTIVPASRVMLMRHEGKSLQGTTSVAYPTATPTPTPTAPGVISGLTATAGSGQAVLAFSAPANGGAAITDYVYQYKLNSASTWTTFSDGTSATPGTTITGLTNGEAYNFRAAAVNSVGQQPTWSNIASATPVAAATVPGVISDLTATAGNGQATLSFTAPSNGGAAISDYIYQYKLAADSTWTTFADGTSGVSGATITGLTNGQAYNFRAAAVNSVGQQPTWSNVANATPVAPAASYTAGFTLSQFQSYDEKRIYQRTTTAGGGQGKGSGTIRVPLSGTVTAGTIGARIRSADGTTILQPEWTAGTIANGASYIDVSGIDSRLGWFFVDLKGADGSWQLGTVQVGMGRLVGTAGQSLMARMVGRQDGQSATYASLGVTIDPNTAVLASYSESNNYMPTPSTAPWQVPGDMTNGTGPNSVGCGEFLRRQVALFGVNCGLIGHSQGGSSLNTFLSGGGNYAQFSGILARAGGAFEAFIWGQGHSDAGSGVPAAGYATGLDMLFAGIAALNSFAGMRKYVWTVPTISNSTWGTPFQRNRIRKGAVSWCAANSATYIHMEDIAQVDGVHESQAGAITMARAWHRATRTETGASGNDGPAILSAVRSGTTVTLNLSDVGQSSLVLTGTPANRFRLFSKGYCDNFASSGANAFPVSAVSAVNKTTLSLTLANDPGAGHVLDLHVFWPNDPSDATVDMIRDDRTDGDGITVGRALVPNPVPVTVAAPTPGGAVNAPPGGYVDVGSPFDMVATSPTYGAGASGFGNEMTGGTAQAANNKTPYFSPITVEGFFTCPTIPASTQVLFGGIGSNFIAINSGGKIATGAGGPTTTTLIAGHRYHVAWQAGPNGSAIYITDLTAGTPGAREYYSATGVQISPQGGRLGLRNHLGSFALSGGGVDEWAVFESERYSGAGYTCPSAPFSGSESNLVALYHCDSDVKDAAAS